MKSVGIYENRYSFGAKRTGEVRGRRTIIEKKEGTISLTCRHFLCLTLSGSLVTRAIERTKHVRWTRLVGVTIFMANSRKNDQPNKLLAHAIKNASGIGGGKTGIEKKGRRGIGVAEGQRGRRLPRGGEISQLGRVW